MVVGWRALTALGVMVLAGVASCGGGAVTTKPLIEVTPSVGLWDKARAIEISNLRVGQVVTVGSRTVLPDGVYHATATFRASPAGVVDVARAAPVSGSYEGIAPMGLLWSERPSILRSEGGHGRAVTRLLVSVGGRQVASASLTQLLDGPGVASQLETVGKAGFFGVFYSPRRGRRPAPGVILWGGSEGGEGGSADLAGLLASHGIPALAVAYFDEPHLPCRLQDIPLEYFVRAIRWLGSQPGVDRSRLWILSGSRGTEAAFLVAADWPRLVHGVVADSPSAWVRGPAPGNCAPSSVTASAWTRNGKVVPQGPLPAGRVVSDVLLIAGGRDIVDTSAANSAELMTELPRNHSVHKYLFYPDAGHAVLWIPFSPAYVVATEDGGTVAGNAEAWASDWPATLAFIANH